MSVDLILAIIALAATMTWTPGPNNLMLAASGAAFGFVPTIGHAVGVAVGFPVMLLLVAAGLAPVFAAVPELASMMSWIGLLAMLWFAWKIYSSSAGETDAARKSAPMRFWQAAAFQWVNPKAWAFAVWIAASYATGADAVVAMATVAGIFLMSGLASSSAWALGGAAIGRMLGSSRRRRVFNAIMAATLVVSAVWITFAL